MSKSWRVGIVGLGEAGNLGDDLILIATVDAVFAANPTASITFLSHGHELDWKHLTRVRGYPSVPRRVRATFEIPFLRQNARKYRDRDVVIFGGGGLLQTSHNADRPYEWLSYLPQAGAGRPRVLATGLGLGPISEAWIRRLRGMKTPFDDAWFRDPDSVALAENELGWPAKECRDFVERAFLATLSLLGMDSGAAPRRLGVALRAWPGFTAEAAATHIASIADRHGCEDVIFFVLESNRGRGIDVDFSAYVASLLNLPTRVRTYQPRDLSDFLEDMTTVELAVSMKLHSSAIWGALGVSMYPIFYAPKVAAFFGAKYRGFEIVDAVVPVPDDVRGASRASETIVAGLQALSAKAAATGSRFSRRTSYFYQFKHLVTAVGRRITLLPLVKK